MNEILQLRLGDGSLISVVIGDITAQETDAIVNAANSSLMGGGGVDGAVHRAGGPAILEECKKIVAEHGRLPAGEAVATTGGKLRAAFVIHTVGPIWHGGEEGEPEVLTRCYSNSIALADRMRLTNLAFPAISTGAFGYPAPQAADIAFAATVAALDTTRSVREVRFVLFDETMFRQFVRAAKNICARNPKRYRLDTIRGLNTPNA